MVLTIFIKIVNEEKEKTIFMSHIGQFYNLIMELKKNKWKYILFSYFQSRF